jgi:hypothetical protein
MEDLWRMVISMDSILSEAVVVVRLREKKRLASQVELLPMVSPSSLQEREESREERRSEEEGETKSFREGSRSLFQRS